MTRASKSRDDPATVDAPQIKGTRPRFLDDVLGEFMIAITPSRDQIVEVVYDRAINVSNLLLRRLVDTFGNVAL